jgi:hypothetical protein
MYEHISESDHRHSEHFSDASKNATEIAAKGPASDARLSDSPTSNVQIPRLSIYVSQNETLSNLPNQQHDPDTSELACPNALNEYELASSSNTPGQDDSSM